MNSIRPGELNKDGHPLSVDGNRFQVNGLADPQARPRADASQ